MNLVQAKDLMKHNVLVVGQSEVRETKTFGWAGSAGLFESGGGVHERAFRGRFAEGV